MIEQPPPPPPPKQRRMRPQMQNKFDSETSKSIRDTHQRSDEKERQKSKKSTLQFNNHIHS